MRSYPERRDIMTNAEIINALADIVLKKEYECKAKIAALPKESVLEKKASVIPSESSKRISPDFNCMV